MKKTSLIIALLVILYSCQVNEKSISNLEKASLASGVRNDTIFEGTYFGQKKENAQFISDRKFCFECKELSKYLFLASPRFYNDSLMELQFVAYSFDNNFLTKDSLTSIKNLFSAKYNIPDVEYTKSEDDNSKYYCNIWLKNNQRIEVSYRIFKYYEILIIKYNDLSRDADNKDLIRSYAYDPKSDVYTKVYYDSIMSSNQ